MPVPKYDELFDSLLIAIHELGGSGAISEIEDRIIDILKLPEKDVNQIHKGNTTKLAYRLAWARNYLKRYGLLENSARGVWSLTSKGREITKVDKEAVKRVVRQMSRPASVEEEVEEGTEPESDTKTWQEKMIEKLLNMSPSSFEQLCQRILRESGFVKVEVTGKTGDGGIDGKGIVKMNGLLSFHIIFQCKKYSGTVSASQIRDFRGAMTGRSDKGLFITTGTFSRDARLEASRDGAPPIDLINGELLVEKMKEFNLGIRVEMEENIEIDNEWFKNFK